MSRPENLPGNTLMPQNIPPVSPSILDDLVHANRILYRREIVDGLGHVSARHDKDPSIYVLAAEKAPGRVTKEDLALFDLDSNALTLTDRRPYVERRSEEHTSELQS